MAHEHRLPVPVQRRAGALQGRPAVPGQRVYPGIIKFLGFEQIFKNSLTGLPIGGGKGGADFDPAGKSDAEIMRFCQAYMQALYRYIGPDVDVPAGDMGVGGREIGYLFGEYRRLKGAWENGVLTGKGFSYGGSLIRPEATGYGAVYYLQNVLEHEGERIAGKTIACAGFGNVTWGICKKATQLGAKVVTLSGPDGYIYDPDGVATEEKIAYLVEMRSSGRNRVQDYAEKFGVEFFPGEKPWGVKADVVMPSAMQNDVHMEQAKQIAANGVKYYIEVANMPTTNDALRFLMEQPGMIVAPSKAVNAGGVATSALEMAQNSERLVWTAEEVDAQLHRIMNTIYQMSVDAAAEYGLGYNLVAGANIAGFKRVAEAMMEQGVFAKGRHIIKVCTGTACHVRKSGPIYDSLRDALGLTGKRKTSADGLFTLETVACLGACGLAPVMTIDGEVHAKMTPEDALALVEDIRRKEAATA